MSSYYYNGHHPTAANASAPSHNHHSGRSRRAPRLSAASQNAHKQFRGVRSMRELTDTKASDEYRKYFELARSFDAEDDNEFCPNLMSESDTASLHSSTSDRSSLSSGSPESSPTQQPQQVTPSFSLNSASNPYIPSGYSMSNSSSSNLKLHQPAATRVRNAIPIVNPSTGISMSSPPPSVSPARMQQGLGRRW
jgi:hypothetical protein